MLTCFAAEGYSGNDPCARVCPQYLVDCDDVILMKEGSIVERGNHDDLMRLNGDYAAMFNHFQLGDAPLIEVSVRLSVCPSVFPVVS